MAILNIREIDEIGFAAIGKNVQISDKASIYSANRIKIGDNVRIDDFCVLSPGIGGIEIGSFVHIAISSSLIGAGKITLGDFCNLSSRVSVYSSSDDYSGLSLTNPTIPDEYKMVINAPVTLGKHVIIGCGSVILPSVHIEDGVAIGALSLVNKNCKAFNIYAGNPIRKIRERKKDLLKLEIDFLENPNRKPLLNKIEPLAKAVG